jgi:hypothetical protein
MAQDQADKKILRGSNSPQQADWILGQQREVQHGIFLEKENCRRRTGQRCGLA